MFSAIILAFLTKNKIIPQKKSISKIEKENSPFVNFCKNNGEIGTKILEQLQDLYDICYGDDQTFISTLKSLNRSIYDKGLHKKTSLN